MVVSSGEANYWWRKNDPAGALLNNLMLLFIAVPVALVIKHLYAASFVVFALIVPYGFFVRYLAVRAVERYLQNHPDELEQFEQDGIISSRSGLC
jgi:hypothetical protein